MIKIEGREAEFKDTYERAFSAISELQTAFGQAAVLTLCLDVSIDLTAGGDTAFAEGALRRLGHLDQLEDLKEVKKLVWGCGTPL